MKIRYDKETDTMTIVFRDAPIQESDEVATNIIADFVYTVRWSAWSSSESLRLLPIPGK